MTTKPDTATIPILPSHETLLAMARSFEPGFDTPTSGDTIGLSTSDRKRLLERMETVYGVVVGAHRPTSEVEPSEDAEAWKRSDWLRRLRPSELDLILGRLQYSHSKHWRQASRTISGAGFPLFVRNERIGPLLALRSDDPVRPGLQPYQAMGSPDGYQWYIGEGSLDRWWAVPVPQTALGWLELYSGDDRQRMFEGQEASRLLDALENAVLAGAPPGAVEEALKAFFELLAPNRG